MSADTMAARRRCSRSKGKFPLQLRYMVVVVQPPGNPPPKRSASLGTPVGRLFHDGGGRLNDHAFHSNICSKPIWRNVVDNGHQVETRNTAHFRHDYGSDQSDLRRLYAQVKVDQWNSGRDIDWSVPLEGDGGLISDDLVDIHGTRFWDGLSQADRVELNRRVSRWRLSTLVQGEHGAMLLCSQLVENVQGQDAKLFHATPGAAATRRSAILPRARHPRRRPRYGLCHGGAAGHRWPGDARRAPRDGGFRRLGAQPHAFRHLPARRLPGNGLQHVRSRGDQALPARARGWRRRDRLPQVLPPRPAWRPGAQPAQGRAAYRADRAQPAILRHQSRRVKHAGALSSMIA